MIENHVLTSYLIQGTMCELLWMDHVIHIQPILINKLNFNLLYYSFLLRHSHQGSTVVQSIWLLIDSSVSTRPYECHTSWSGAHIVTCRMPKGKYNNVYGCCLFGTNRQLEQTTYTMSCSYFGASIREHMIYSNNCMSLLTLEHYLFINW
jgi:hypothetical protein